MKNVWKTLVVTGGLVTGLFVGSETSFAEEGDSLLSDVTDSITEGDENKTVEGNITGSLTGHVETEGEESKSSTSINVATSVDTEDADKGKETSLNTKASFKGSTEGNVNGDMEASADEQSASETNANVESSTTAKSNNEAVIAGKQKTNAQMGTRAANDESTAGLYGQEKTANSEGGETHVNVHLSLGLIAKLDEQAYGSFNFDTEQYLQSTNNGHTEEELALPFSEDNEELDLIENDISLLD